MEGRGATESKRTGIALVWGCLRSYYVPSSSFAHHPHLCLLSLGVVLPINVTAIQALVLEGGNHFLYVSLSSHSLRFNSLLPALSQKALGLLRGQVLKVLIAKRVSMNTVTRSLAVFTSFLRLLISLALLRISRVLLAHMLKQRSRSSACFRLQQWHSFWMTSSRKCFKMQILQFPNLI